VVSTHENGGGVGLPRRGHRDPGGDIVAAAAEPRMMSYSEYRVTSSGRCLQVPSSSQADDVIVDVRLPCDQAAHSSHTWRRI
jgi:hypothetical protein